MESGDSIKGVRHCVSSLAATLEIVVTSLPFKRNIEI